MPKKQGRNKTTLTTDMEGMFKGIKEEENEDEDEEEDYGLIQLRNGVVNFVTPSGKRDKKRGRTTLNERTKEGN